MVALKVKGSRVRPKRRKFPRHWGGNLMETSDRHALTFESQVKETVNSQSSCNDDVCTVTWSPDKEQKTDAQKVTENQKN